MKKKQISILKKLYSVANPLIEHLPGKTIEDKRTLFNLLIIGSALTFYLSPLPVVIIRNVHAPIGAFLVGVILMLITIVFGKYLLEVMQEYGERWRKTRKSQGSSRSPESPSMKPETGRHSATNVTKLINLAENQNGRKRHNYAAGKQD